MDYLDYLDCQPDPEPPAPTQDDSVIYSYRIELKRTEVQLWVRWAERSGRVSARVVEQQVLVFNGDWERLREVLHGVVDGVFDTGNPARSADGSYLLGYQAVHCPF